MTDVVTLRESAEALCLHFVGHSVVFSTRRGRQECLQQPQGRMLQTCSVESCSTLISLFATCPSSIVRFPGLHASSTVARLAAATCGTVDFTLF